VNYYNEFDPKAAAWLRELIKEGLIPNGHVDERSIADVTPAELAGFTQCHFFAGIGGWSEALRLAGWPEDKPVWTGSCPCQPFSIANQNGGGLGKEDSRHLWPEFFRLAAKRNPPVIFGEQVASALRQSWLDEVFSDLEGVGYACGSAVLPANAFGAGHERKRIFWVADSRSERWERPEPVEFISGCERETLPVNGDVLVESRRVLEGDFRDLLPCDGLSLKVERDAIKGYGNAIVPQVAAEFIRAFQEVTTETQA